MIMIFHQTLKIISFETPGCKGSDVNFLHIVYRIGKRLVVEIVDYLWMINFFQHPKRNVWSFTIIVKNQLAFRHLFFELELHLAMAQWIMGKQLLLSTSLD